jgi:hypothetical protein
MGQQSPETAMFVWHLAALAFLSWRTAQHLVKPLAERLAALFLIMWANIVYTGLILGSIGQLKNVAAYLTLSLLLGLLPWRFLRWRGADPVELPDAMASDGSIDGAAKIITRILWVIWGIVAICTAVVALSHAPNNWDTMVYRFPRGVFYLGEGSLKQFGTGDARLVAYPLAATLLYIFPAMYHIISGTWTLVVYGNWIVIAYAVWLAARRVGASQFGAQGAAWCCAMAPCILIQATAGNDDSLAATPYLIGVSFLIAWWRNPDWRLMFLGMLGLALGMGTKIHTVFHWFAVFPFAVAAIHAYRANLWPAQWGIRIRQILASGIVAAPVTAAFLYFAYTATGTISNPMSDSVLHSKGEGKASAQTLYMFTLELALKPLADIPVITDPQKRVAHYEGWNRWMQKTFLDGFQPAPGFAGPGEPWHTRLFDTSLFYYEHSVTPGLLPFAMLAALITALVWRRPGESNSGALVLFLISFFAWHIGFGLIHRIIFPQLGTYYGYPVVLAAPGMALLWDRVYSAGNGRLLARAVLCLLVATNVMTAANVLMYNSLRNVKSAWQGGFNVARWKHGDDFIEFIQTARSILVPTTFWAMEHWDYMKLNPRASFTTGKDVAAIRPGTDTVLLLHRATDVGAGILAAVPVYVPGLPGGGFTFIDSAFDGIVHAFSRGATASRLFPDRTGYLLYRARLDRVGPRGEFTKFWLYEIAGARPGAEPMETRFEFRSSQTGKRSTTTWMSIEDAKKEFVFAAADRFDTWIVYTRNPKEPQRVAINTRPLALGTRIDWAEYRIADVLAGNLTTVTHAITPLPDPGSVDSPGWDKVPRPVRWLGKNTEFRFQRELAGEATLRLNISRYKTDKRVRVFVNDELVTPQPIAIDKTYWYQGFVPIQAKVRLKAGPNVVRLESEGQVDKLDNGIEVHLMLVGALNLTTMEPREF